MKIALRLDYFPVNAAWAFTFGGAIETRRPTRLHNEDLFFDNRRAATQAAKRRGLVVKAGGECEVDGSIS